MKNGNILEIKYKFNEFNSLNIKKKCSAFTEKDQVKKLHYECNIKNNQNKLKNLSNNKNKQWILWKKQISNQEIVQLFQ